MNDGCVDVHSNPVGATALCARVNKFYIFITFVLLFLVAVAAYTCGRLNLYLKLLLALDMCQMNDGCALVNCCTFDPN